MEGLIQPNTLRVVKKKYANTARGLSIALASKQH